MAKDVIDLDDELAAAGTWRAALKTCPLQDKKRRTIQLLVNIADFLHLPDDMPLLPAMSGAKGPLNLCDRKAIARTRKRAHAAGWAALCRNTASTSDEALN